MKWNPHIHTIVTEGAMEKNNIFKKFEYICPKCKTEFKSPIEIVEEFEEEDMLNGLPISTPPYIICPKCQHKKCVPLDYKSKRGYHHKYKK